VDVVRGVLDDVVHDYWLLLEAHEEGGEPVDQLGGLVAPGPEVIDPEAALDCLWVEKIGRRFTTLRLRSHVSGR
jgi:hypothetical protein